MTDQKGLTVAHPTTSTPGGAYVKAEKGSELVAVDDPLQGFMPGGIAVRGDVVRIPIVTRIPAVYQHAIGWPKKVTLTAAGYDYINRDLGVRFYEPAQVPDPAQDGALRANPIIRKDYILLALVGQWWNDMGQMMTWRELIEVDYQLVYHDARFNAKSAEVLMQDGQVVYDERTGMPAVRLNKEDELKALRQLSMLRTFGTRYVRTVARTRILKVATGIVELPGQKVPDPERPGKHLLVPIDNVPVRLVAFRDNLTPDEAAAQAEASIRALFGSATKPASYSAADLVSDQVMADLDAYRTEGGGLDDEEEDDGAPVAFDPTTIPGVSRGMPPQAAATQPQPPKVITPDEDVDIDPEDLERYIQEHANRG